MVSFSWVSISKFKHFRLLCEPSNCLEGGAQDTGGGSLAKESHREVGGSSSGMWEDLF